MRDAPRSRAVVLALTVASAALSLPACQGDKPVEKQEANPPATEQSKAEVKKSLEELTAQVGKLRSAMAEVSAKAKALPDDMPDLEAFRSKLFAIEEGLGTDDGRVKWLSGKLDAAIASGSKPALEEVSKEIQQMIAGHHAEVIVGLSHQLMGFEGRVFRRTLPTGDEIKGAKAGVEQRLLAFIEDGEKKIDKTAWFAFDRISYSLGDTKLNFPESKSQIENVAAILKAFPRVGLKIGDFTEEVVPVFLNKRLSRARAESIKSELVALGVAAPRLQATGYGPQEFLCPANDTAECKLKNRRIAVQVTAK